MARRTVEPEPDVEVEGGTTEPLLGPTAAPGTAELARLPRLARHTVTLPDGHQVGVAVCGEGIPFVVVHGFSAEGFLYAQTLWRLVDMGFKVVAIDTAGHGGTQGLPTGGADFAAYTDLLRRVLDALGIRKGVFAGHSMGGRLVTQLAAVDPDRVIAVLLVDAIVGKTWDRIVWVSRLWPPVLAGVAAGLVIDTLSTVPLFRDPAQARKLGRLIGPTLIGHVRRPWRLLGPAASILRSRGSGWMLDDIRAKKIPIFAVHGDRDIVVPLATARDAARRANGVLVVVEGATHSWLLKDPESMPGIVFELMKGELGTAVLRAKLKAGIDSGDRSEIDQSPAFYDPDSLAVALTPHQPWHDDAGLHRKARYTWRIGRD
ncbi:MAG: alpha/beta hydrolase [Actinomycetota bacterium]|nr:alpha/beta hydrolase [Acidimicrobiia bacterium]MDQ3293365.1 alpha/beta hydrolase [Actinomycetota bacterium]